VIFKDKLALLMKIRPNEGENDTLILDKEDKNQEIIEAGKKELLQVSSEISADLPADWRRNLGTILEKITPAGSITGTPKKKTMQIIEKVENYDRGFYTGVFGICRPEELRSAVMIRFVEKNRNGMIYKSGGGITLHSDPRSEYRELESKIYLPL
jgi:para-aminobenzoate synthetase component 1